jgi:nucleoside diphosphate kinase
VRVRKIILGYLIHVYFSSGICALILEKEDAIKDWKFLMGPANYKKARKSNPNS